MLFIIKNKFNDIIYTYYRLALRAQENQGGGIAATIIIYLGLSLFVTELLNLLKVIPILIPVVIILQMLIVIYCLIGIIVSFLVYFNIIKPEGRKKKKHS